MHSLHKFLDVAHRILQEHKLRIPYVMLQLHMRMCTLRPVPASVQNTTLVDALGKLCDKWFDALAEHKRLNCRELVPCDRLNALKTTTRYFDAFATPDNGCDPADSEHFPALVENWFLFSLIWGLGGSLDEGGRKAFDGHVREMDARFPTLNTVFDYVFDGPTKTWVPWESRLTSTFRPPAGVPFFKILVPTVDTYRNRCLGGALVRGGHHVLFTGAVGVGKTMVAASMLDDLPDARASMTINFSAQTSSNSLQARRELAAAAIFLLLALVLCQFICSHA
jgi:dynein heavy chain, axonemal